MSLADVLRVARAQVGATEAPPGSNRQKYGAAQGANGLPWCAQACWWVWREAGHDILPKTASVEVLWRYAQKQGWVRQVPTVGAIPVYSFPGGLPFDHVGIVVTRVIDATRFAAIEGNTSPDDQGSQSNGGGVFERVRRVNQTHGFICPPIEEDDVPLTPAEITAIGKEAARAVWAHGFPLADGPNPPVETAGIRLVQAARGGGLADDVTALRDAVDRLTHGSPVTLPADQIAALAGVLADQVIARAGPAVAAEVAAELGRRLT